MRSFWMTRQRNKLNSSIQKLTTKLKRNNNNNKSNKKDKNKVNKKIMGMKKLMIDLLNK